MDSIYGIVGLVCLVLLYLSVFSKTSYYLKMFVFTFGSCLIVLLCIPFMVLRPKDYRNGQVPALVCRYLGKLIGIRVEVRGIENIRKEHGSVTLLNHQSCLDLLILAHLWPIIGRATVVAKKPILFLPFFGVGAWLWGTLFINRSNKTNSIQSINHESKAIQERNCKLLFFPEATRNSEKSLLPFKKGSFHVAVQTKCPIQPVVISHYYFLNYERKIFNPGHMIISILPEISTEDYSKNTIDDLIKYTRSTMLEEFLTINKQCM